MESVSHLIIYCRSSTDKQVNIGSSVENQIKACKDWNSANGNYPIKGIYKDEGITGKPIDDENFLKKVNMIRDPVCKKIPGISHRQGLIDAIKNTRKGDIFLTYSMTRLSRNATQSLVIFDFLKSKKCHIVCISDHINTMVDKDDIRVHISGIFSQLEHKAISERTKLALQNKLAQGQYCGRIPYGWKWKFGKSGDDLVEVPEEQEIIKIIRDLRSEKNRLGRPIAYGDIAKHLNEKGILTRAKKPWCHSTVSRVCEAKPPKMKGNIKKQLISGSLKPSDLKEDDLDLINSDDEEFEINLSSVENLSKNNMENISTHNQDTVIPEKIVDKKTTSSSDEEKDKKNKKSKHNVKDDNSSSSSSSDEEIIYKKKKKDKKKKKKIVYVTDSSSSDEEVVRKKKDKR
jgi:DNA invertase Pin-like site-specific DNA recombinase